jgi:hypothetical protein
MGNQAPAPEASQWHSSSTDFQRVLLKQLHPRHHSLRGTSIANRSAFHKRKKKHANPGGKDIGLKFSRNSRALAIPLVLEAAHAFSLQKYPFSWR